MVITLIIISNVPVSLDFPRIVPYMALDIDMALECGVECAFLLLTLSAIFDAIV